MYSIGWISILVGERSEHGFVGSRMQARKRATGIRCVEGGFFQVVLRTFLNWLDTQVVFSCKRRHFCPSCHQKRVVEVGEWVCGEVLKKVPHRHFVFSIPNIHRRYFLYDRSLLSELSHCAWEAMRPFFQDAVPGVFAAIQ